MSEDESIADRWMRRYREENQAEVRAIEAQCDQGLFGLKANNPISTAEQSKTRGVGLSSAVRVGITLCPVVTSAIQVRKQLRFTQSAFARCLNISPRTLRDWEQGRRQPSGAALTLLAWVVDNPECLK